MIPESIIIIFEAEIMLIPGVGNILQSSYHHKTKRFLLPVKHCGVRELTNLAIEMDISTAQLAIAWYKLGELEPADKALNCLIGLQTSTGGFCGSYGSGKMYLPDEEISWAVKFFLDALLLRERQRLD